jgi:hypothetical protein
MVQIDKKIEPNSARTSKQISDLLEVDLHVGYFNQVLQVWVRLDDGLENLLCYTWDYTLQFIVVDVGALRSHCVSSFLNYAHEITHHHSEGLAGTCLTVGKDCAVVAIEHI